MTWYGLKKISHVAATIMRNFRLKEGADIQVYKQTYWLRYHIHLEALCDMHRRIELTIVITHSNHQVDGQV